MVTKARIENGVVREILTAEPFPEFHPSLVWIECSPEVQEGWRVEGDQILPPPGPDMGSLREQARAQIDNELSVLSKKPIEYEGVPFDADSLARERINGVLLRLVLGGGLR